MIWKKILKKRALYICRRADSGSGRPGESAAALTETSKKKENRLIQAGKKKATAFNLLKNCGGQTTLCAPPGFNHKYLFLRPTVSDRTMWLIVGKSAVCDHLYNTNAASARHVQRICDLRWTRPLTNAAKQVVTPTAVKELGRFRHTVRWRGIVWNITRYFFY